MEREQKRHGETPAAFAPADVFEVRKLAARVREVHRHDLDYTPARFRADVLTALLGAGREAEDGTVDEAIAGMQP